MMGSRSGNSFWSYTRFQNLGSEEELQVEMLERKRKRMEANRESARRSRMRKQKHLNDVAAQVATLRKENSELVASINMATHLFQNVEAENSILRAQMAELTQTLRYLNHIIDLVSTRTRSTSEALNFALCHNQHIMACADMFQW
ncbi:bZIP transcription factor 44-like [Prosopis cineraria]|uniref:bZIP transcription factor 44-like n=1 Tax=Prosopis cineraria TaxID=364024 RepID=UPI00240F0CB5|nr:bZIP transcription factor 44-like [Prosopis cineraria]